MPKISIVAKSNNNDYKSVLESILAQNIKDVEIIPHEDLELFDSGVNGEYVAFADFSKGFNSDILKLTYDVILKENSDIVIFNAHACPEGKQSHYPKCKRLGAYWTVIAQGLYEREDFFSICNAQIAIIKSEYLKKLDIPLKKAFTFEFLVKALVNTSEISAINECLFDVEPKNIIKSNKTLCAKEKENAIQIELEKKYKNNYAKTISRLKNAEKLRVLFLVNEVSKWKGEALYNEMVKSDKFEPFMVVTISDIQFNYTNEQKTLILEESYNFFKNKNMKCFTGYDPKTDNAVDLAEFKPDIVFYEQPYNINWLQDIPSVSKYALTCYFPYYIASFKNLALDCGRFFHNGLFRFYVLNEEFKDEYSSFMWNKGANLRAVGHPTLDLIDYKTGTGEYVIYAPHWSIKHPKNPNDINISTFIEYGEFMLEYAKANPEIKWAFKPHPTLKTTLGRVYGVEWAENYYKEWEKIAKCCYDSDYIELFNNSRLLITDSNSFLVEYFCTAKPVIHLLSKDTELESYEYNKKILESFYSVNNKDELCFSLKKLAKRREDTQKESRLELLREYGFLNRNFAEKITEDLKNLMRCNANLLH